MQTTTKTQRSLVLSYLGLRKSLGIIGITLPIVLVVGKMILDGPGLLDSLSAYYYSVMRDVWVGGLCAIGVFLFSYRYALHDEIVGDLAGASAIGVALFPAAPEGATAHQVLIGRVHEVFGVSLFVFLAYFALVLFRRMHPDRPPTPQKLQRNRVYLGCGLTILACLALLGLAQFLPAPAWLQGLHPSLWLESLALWTFGLAWFIKGGALLKDK